MATFEIQSRSDIAQVSYGSLEEEHTGRFSNWSSDGIGTDNVFDTEDEAEEGIEQLRKLGEEWAAAEYRVHEIADEHGGYCGCDACYSRYMEVVI